MANLFLYKALIIDKICIYCLISFGDGDSRLNVIAFDNHSPKILSSTIQSIHVLILHLIEQHMDRMAWCSAGTLSISLKFYWDPWNLRQKIAKTVSCLNKQPKNGYEKAGVLKSFKPNKTKNELLLHNSSNSSVDSILDRANSWTRWLYVLMVLCQYLQNFPDTFRICTKKWEKLEAVIQAAGKWIWKGRIVGTNRAKC